MEDLYIANIRHAVAFLQSAYTIVLALALGEAFKQFVAEDRDIHWDRLPALAGFLVMIFPFFHGMSRYLFATYLEPGLPRQNFAIFLMIDGIVFMLMSAFFFVMSRSLSPERWRRFYGALIFLLAVDSAWIGLAIYRGRIDIHLWLVLNGVLAYAMSVIYLAHEARKDSIWPVTACAFVCMFTTCASYYYMAEFYFPKYVLSP